MTETMSFADSLQYTPRHPERTAKSYIGWSVHFREWASRKAMLKTIEMQGRRASRAEDWKPCIKFGEWPEDRRNNEEA